MIKEMMGQRGKACDLALVRSPKDFARRDPGFPGIRPGLYVGDYGHQFYGQFRTEVILLEYVSLSPQEMLEEATQPTRVFQRPHAVSSEANRIGQQQAVGLARLAELAREVTFVRGIKQCGDFHVPMGATTFVAI